jgi:tetraacyldisaccharide 4'-kinase
MNLNFLFFKTIRILLLPFSFVYALMVIVRNWCYDLKWMQSASFNMPLICVGNLAVGGTGKSPMVELLIKKLKDQFRIAVLSRGYMRKTSGYALADEDATALDIGDEPMQFKMKFPDVPIAVGEERVVAIPQLLHDLPDTKVIILDDAFQHRAVTAGLNILLTECSNLFTRDWYLPTGDLRDQKKSYKRAEVIVVTKCDPAFSLKERNDIINEICPLENQEVFFSYINYGEPYHIRSRAKIQFSDSMEVLLVSGIANPTPLKKYLDEQTQAFYEMDYSDHHIFTIDDLKSIIKRFDGISTSNKIILTTEKDSVRLTKFAEALKDLPMYVIPIESGFLFQEEKRFTEIITSFIRNFKYQ